jgi:quercetin dioxygenase-like cupin family protein
MLAPRHNLPMKSYQWTDIQEEQLNPLAGRRALHGEKITVARFRFDKGNQVAMHHHANDQITIVQSGAVRMVVAGEEMQLKAGDMMHVPPDVPHGNEALEDTVIIEVFSPVREDWIRGDDSYLRRK